MSGDLETDTLMTNTGTGTFTSHDYAILVSKIRQLKLENEQLKRKCDLWKENFCKLRMEFPPGSSHITVEELTRKVSELDLGTCTVSSQQSIEKQVLRQQFSTDGHNSFQSDPYHSQVTVGDTSEVSLKCSPEHHPPASAPNSLIANASVQSDAHHSRVTLGDIEGSLPCSSQAYHPASAQNSVSANANVTQKSRIQVHPIPVKPPHKPVNQQPEDSETKGEMVLPGGGERGGFHLDKPGILKSFQPQKPPTQVTSLQGNTAVVPANTVNPPAASVPPAANSQVSRKRNLRSVKGKVVTSEMIDFIEGKVIRKRRELVRKLGLTDDNIDEIEYTYRNDSAKEIVHQLLKKWIQNKGCHATIGAMLKALKEIGRKDVFDEFCDKFDIIHGKVVTSEMIDFIEGKVIRKRRELVRKLGLTDDNIDEIEYTYRNDSAKEIVHQLLKKWIQNKGCHATIGAMLKALKEIGRKDVFDEFCDKFDTISISSDEDISNEEQREIAVPQDAKLHEEHQQSATTRPIQADSEHDTRQVVPSSEQVIKYLNKKSEPAPPSNFDSFFSDFMLNPSTKGKKDFRKDLDKKKNFRREETKKIANEMDWDSSDLSDKFDLEVKANLKVSNVLDKWAGILLNENPHMTKAEKREHIQDMVRSLRGEKDGREDVIAEIRKHLFAGTVGTQAPPHTQYTDLPYGMRYRLVLELNMLDPRNGGGCSLVAENLGIENNLIRYLTTRPEPGHQVLRSWETQADATVGKLYDVLIFCNAMKAVAVLE